jgi:ATP-dependent helicase/nuclease subunit B
MAMEHQRQFIGRDKPFCLAFSEQLKPIMSHPGGLADCLIWVPSARAGRHILNELFSGVGAVEAFHPPRFVTPARFMDGLLESVEVASETQCLLAWKTVLLKAGAHRLKPVFPVVPEENPQDWAYAIAAQMIHLKSRLAEENATMASVLEQVPEMDVDRWQCLAHLEESYLEELNRRKLPDPDTYLGENMEHLLSILPYKKLLVAGILNLTQRQAACLGLLSAKGIEINYIVPAHPDEESTFDELGRPRPGTWDKQALPDELLSGCIMRTGEPREAADSLLELSDSYKDQIDALVIGCPEDEIGEYLVERSQLGKVPFYAPRGLSLLDTAWGRFLSAIIKRSSEDSFESLLLLLRHSLLRKWISGQDITPVKVERAIQRLRIEQLLTHVDQLYDKALGPSGDVAIVKQFIECIDCMFEHNTENESLADQVWRALRLLAESNPTTESQRKILFQMEDVLQELKEEFVDDGIPEADQKRLLEYRMEQSQYYPERETEERPVTGWLELPWEVAPHLVIFGLPDAEVPGSDGTDAFLTPSLCRKLGFYGTDEAVAFHAFRLRLILESRKSWGKLDILLPDRGMGDDPVRPSRFLFLSDAETVSQRVHSLLGDRPVLTQSLPAEFGCVLNLPEPPAVEKMSVTGFSAYLRNPFGFYLKTLMRWEPPEALPSDMDAMRFGSLAHTVLEALNRDVQGKSLIEQDDIFNFLSSQLNTVVASVHGTRIRVPVRIQIESMRERLRGASHVIAEERQKGWLPYKVEWAFHNEIPFIIEGVSIRGKIDLLERNEESGEYRIIDYKTSDKNDGPCKVHLSTVRSNSADPLFKECDFETGGKWYRWSDLQLPLYQLAAKEALGVFAQCGYISLSKAVKDIRLDTWTPTEEQSAAAMNCARSILKNIHEGHFPLPDKISNRDPWLPWFADDFKGAINPQWIDAHGGSPQ